MDERLYDPRRRHMDNLLVTTKGLIDRANLRIEEVEHDAPCGKVRTTRYFYFDELVKQDVGVVVDALPTITGEVNL